MHDMSIVTPLVVLPSYADKCFHFLSWLCCIYWDTHVWNWLHWVLPRPRRCTVCWDWSGCAGFLESVWRHPNSQRALRFLVCMLPDLGHAWLNYTWPWQSIHATTFGFNDKITHGKFPLGHFFLYPHPGPTCSWLTKDPGTQQILELVVTFWLNNCKSNRKTWLLFKKDSVACILWAWLWHYSIFWVHEPFSQYGFLT